MKNNILYLSIPFLIANLIICMESCKVDECEEIIPTAEYVDLVTHGDTATITLSFKDCDGDLGLLPSDTTAPYEFNLFLEYYQLKNGVWEVVGPLPTPYYYRIPVLETSGNSIITEGEIDISLIPYYLPGYSDTIKYQIYIVDKALNQSNTIETYILVVQ